jgi:hypothetical protein
MARLTLLILLMPSLVNSQAPFELENRKALKLTDNRLKMLLNKEWRVEKVEDDVRGDVREATFSHIGGIKYNPDGTYNHGAWKSGGTWEIVEGKYIRHQIERKQEIRNNFGGTYAVTLLKDSTLILTKLLTSSRDMKRVIYFTLKPREAIKSPFYRPNLYNKMLTLNQIDSISRLTKEQLFESNFKFIKDTVFIPTKDSLYKIKIKPRD